MNLRRRGRCGLLAACLAVAVGAAPTRAEAADAVPAAESAAPADLRAADARGLLGSGFDPGPGWTLQRAEFGPELARLHFRGPEGAALVARVSPLRPGERAFAASAHFAIAHEGQLDDTRDAAALALLRRVADAIRAADDGSVSLPAPVTAPDAVEGSRPPEGRARFAGGSGHEIAPLADFQLGVAALLLALVALALLLRALPTALAALWALPERVWVFGALAVAAALRLAVPSNLVTMFMGYRQTDSALLLADIPRYGAGVHLLHHLTLQVLPVDHESILSLHRVCAIATLPLVAAFVARLSGRPHAATAAAVLLGSAPLMIRDGATESNLLPVVLGLWIGLWLLRRALDGGGRLDALGALAGIGYAMIGRPEQLLVAPLLAAAVVVSAGTDAFRRHRFALLGAGVMLAVLAVPHAVNTFGRSSELHSGLAPLLQFPFDMFMRNVVFWPTWFPAGITLAAIAAVALSAAPARRGQLALWAAALVWGGTYLVDLPHISVPRLMAGSATVVCAVAGVGVPLLRERLAAVASGRRWTVAVFAVWLLSAVATLPRVFEPSNQQLEEQLFREALRMLPPQPACVQRLGDHDPPYGREVHRYHPDYLFRAAGHRVLDLREDPARFGCRETFVLLGTRCYARDRETPTRPGPNRSCRAIRADHRLRPLWETEAALRWDDPFAWWREQTGFRVGVYRVAGSDGAGGGRAPGPAVP